jgi:predicted nucleic acid-binding protein
MPEQSTLYLETTIPSYLAARPSRDLIVTAHQQITHDWCEQARDNFALFISEAVLDEITSGDPEAIARRQAYVENLPILKLTDEVAALAEDYQSQLKLPQNAQLDALHLAYAVVYEMDYLLTWNCKHIANGVIIQRLQSVNVISNHHTPNHRYTRSIV